jgi:DNA repair photolyase
MRTLCSWCNAVIREEDGTGGKDSHGICKLCVEGLENEAKEKGLLKRSVIYEPKGKAAEYAPLALNLYRGCGHCCAYCFVPLSTHTTRGVFHHPGWIAPRPSILQDLEIQARSMAGDPRPILLSFTSDPYQPLEKKTETTRKALIILNRNNLTATILTKGGCWGLARDYYLLQMEPLSTWAVTLTHYDLSFSRAWEPKAADPNDRIRSLASAKHLGLNTWVSFEPVIDPKAVYRLLEATHEFTDHYKVGKLNYHPHAQTIDWRRFKNEIEERLVKLGKPYYLKRDLLEAAA